jgi:hypothetical protein
LKEQWKPVTDFERTYEVSSLGRIRNTKTHALLAAGTTKAGYLRVHLRDGNVSKNVYVHILVAKKFVPNPNNFPQVNHKGPKNDCRATMLEWRSTAGHGKDIALRNQRGDGVHYEAARKKWKARYSPLGKSNVFIGRFNTYEEAKTARDRAVNNMEVTD